MIPFTRQGLAGAPTTARVRRGDTPSDVAIVLYGVRDDVLAECDRLATALSVARVEVKHLQAACSALSSHPSAVVVASSEIVKPWDREVLDDHAARIGVPIRWVDAHEDGDHVAEEVRGLLEARVRARTR